MGKEQSGPRADCDNPRMIQHAETVEEDIVIQVRTIAEDEPKVCRLQQADWLMLQQYDPVIGYVIE